MSDYVPEVINIQEYLTSENSVLKNRIATLEAQISVDKEQYYNYKNGAIDKFFPKKLANLLIKKHNLIYFAGENPYCYVNGVYKESKTVLSSISKYISFQDPYSVKHITDTKKQIIYDSFIDEGKINNKNLVNFRNCFYDLTSRTTVKHSPEIYSTFQVKANYLSGQSIKDTMFLKFLQDGGCSDNLIDLIREMIGYCLTPSTEAQKMFIIVGKPRTSKSTLVNIIRGLFERQFVSSIKLEDLSKGEYLAKLVGKGVNICGDIGRGYIKDISTILQLLGDKQLTVRPLYVNPYEVSLTAKQIFCSNMIALVNDITGAWLRRMITIPFNKKINEASTITDLDTVILNAEADILASWALDSFKDLKERKFQFKETSETIAKRTEYGLENNSLEAFVKNYCIINNDNPEYFITVSEFKNYYRLFCEIDDITPQDYRHLKYFIKENLNLKEGRCDSICKNRHYKGIAWNNSIRELKDEKQKDINFDKSSRTESFIDNYIEVEREGIENE